MLVESFPQASSQLEYSLWCNTGSALAYIWLAHNPVEVLNERLSLLVGCYALTMVIRVLNKDQPWFDDQCRHAFRLKLEADLRWTRNRSRVNWEEFVLCQVHES